MNIRKVPLSSILLAGMVAFFFTGCDSKPIAVDLGDNGHNLSVFSSRESASFSYQDSVSIGNSSRTYIGKIDDQRTSALLIKLNTDILSGHRDICSAPGDSILYEDAYLHLKSYTQLVEENIPWTENNNNADSESGGTGSTPVIQNNYSLKAFWIDFDSYGVNWTEDTIFEFADDSTVVLGLTPISLTNPELENELRLNVLPYDIRVYFESADPTDEDNINSDVLFDTVCENPEKQYGILLVETDPERRVELYASDYLYLSHVPTLDLNYNTWELRDSSMAKYEIDDIQSLIEDGVLFFSTEDETAGMTLIFPDSLTMITQGNEIPFLVEENMLDQDLEIARIVLNLDDFVQDSTQNIEFYFETVRLTFSDLDPSLDNYDGSDLDLTENNLQYDIGEPFFDCGIDNICNTDEPAYNPAGTEGNGSWDLGEVFYDTGVDSLLSANEPGYDPVDNPDPNDDDYNIDPALDDWKDCGADGLCSDDPLYPGEDSGENDDTWNEGELFEGNGHYDSFDLNASGSIDDGEYEHYQDTGVDGIFDVEEPGYDAVLNPDPNGDNWSTENPLGTELNAVWDIGEPYVDAGLDGFWSWEEIGYNATGSEGNGVYNYGELFEDCGSDGICNEDPDAGDDYNPDPAGDDYHYENNLLGTENNSILDWADTLVVNGRWDAGEGEEWFDWGVDQLPDSLEQYYGGNGLLASLGTNYYSWNYLDDPLLEHQVPASYDDVDAAFWISNLSLISENTAELTISIRVRQVINGIQFRLNHLPFTYQTEMLTEKNDQVNVLSGEKIFDDISLYKPADFDPGVPVEYMDVNYSENLNSILDITALNIFTAAHENSIVSKAELTLYIKEAETNIKNNTRLYVSKLDEPVNFTSAAYPAGDLVMSNAIYSGSYKLITEDTDSLVINLKSFVQGLSAGSYLNYGLHLKTDGTTDNFSHLLIYNENGADSTKFPKINILYSE